MTAASQPTTITPASVAVAEQPLLEVRHLKKFFPVRGGVFSTVKAWVKAVDDVSFTLDRGETLGLVGESGCGKTTVGRSILRLIPQVEGQVLYQGQDVLQLSRSAVRALRQEMQIVFQDPYGSLNPRMTVAQIVGEPLWLHRKIRGAELRSEVQELLRQVGLQAHVLDRYPHEFSGGQRQRIGVARALALQPKFIVCDEPTSALDVSIRAQIVNLLQDLQQSRGLSYLFISHDLGVVRHISRRVAVMYLGRIVEVATTDEIFRDPRHPYTNVLLSAIPVPKPQLRAQRVRVKPIDNEDSVPSPINVPAGCAFHPRCPLYHAKGKPELCRTALPELVPLSTNATHQVRCHFAEDAKLIS